MATTSGEGSDLVATATHNVAAVAHRAEQALTESTVIEHLPGHSVAVIGYGMVAVAALLDLVPGEHGSGFFAFGYRGSYFIHAWAFAMLALAVMAAGVRVLPDRGWPPAAKSAAVPAVLATLAVAEAYLVFSPNLIPLVVALGAAILAYDALRSGLARTAWDWTAAKADGIGNRTTIGIALVAAALLISWLPGDPKVVLDGVVVLGADIATRAWGIALLALGATSVAADREGPLTPYAPWVQGATALLYAAWAVTIFNTSLLPMVWLAGAALLAYDQVARARARANGELRVHLLATGPRQLVLAGVPLCLFAMSLRWMTVRTPGTFIGGFNADGTFNATATRIPGYAFGRTGFGLGPSGFPITPLVVAALLALVVLAFWESSRALPGWTHLAPAALVAATTAWLALNYHAQWGPALFVAGTVLLAGAALFTALPRMVVRTAPTAIPH
jgi:hypothetical protein